MWLYLTSKWFSFRLPDNEKAERKTIHPFWRAAQEYFMQYASENEVKAVCRSAEAASPECAFPLSTAVYPPLLDFIVGVMYVYVNRRTY